MQMRTIWQQGSTNPENASSFATISQWWAGLNGKEVTWRQRLIPPSGDINDLNWDPQRFDETFVIQSPEVRGITLYWHKPDTQPDAKSERNTTVHKLELDHLQQTLYIYPQSQRDLVIRVALPQVVYQQVKMQNPVWTVTTSGGQSVLTLRDESQRLEIQVALDQNNLNHLKQQLG